jgi:hypothetical protein
MPYYPRCHGILQNLRLWFSQRSQHIERENDRYVDKLDGGGHHAKRAEAAVRIFIITTDFNVVIFKWRAI